MEVSSVVNMAQAAVADTNFTSRLTGAMATASSAQHLRATKLAAFTSQSSQQASRSLKPSPPQLQGAGAILGTWLVYTGWKFPHCVVVDADDRFIFDVEVLHLASVPPAVVSKRAINNLIESVATLGEIENAPP